MLWDVGPDAVAQAWPPPDASPFPRFPAASHLQVVSVPPTTNTSTRLTLASIQGLVNRDRAELYLDVDGELGVPDSLLAFLARQYGLTYEALDVDGALLRYLPRLRGLVVYDPARSESVNVATVLSSSMHAAIAGPDTAATLNRSYGIPILFDYAASDWARLDAIGASDRALAELYPRTSPRLLSILPPDRVGIRDYLIAANVFPFYARQGALAAPWDLQATVRVLRAAPRGTVILGWFDSPTLTEENAFVQLASREGKVLVGAQDTPNLSVLTALGRGSWRQSAPPSSPTILEDKTYAVVAVADGDNVDFMAGGMRAMWAEPARGTFPVAWSVDPLLEELAPPLLEFYGRSASPADRFVAGPSGAGYVYPDYLGGDLPAYLAFTRPYLERTGLDVAWLLNAFPASEVPYREETLAAYVDALAPRAVVLDYADQPKTRDYWMQEAGPNAAPIIRTTHLWTSRENFLAKVGAAAAAWGAGPQFLWVAVYPYTFGIADAKAVLDELSVRLAGRLELVTPERFFGLLQRDFLERARADVAAGRADPVMSTMVAPLASSAEGHLAAAEVAWSSGRPSVAARQAFLASEDVRAARAWEAFLLIAFLLAGMTALGLRRSRTSVLAGEEAAPLFVFATAAFALFFLALRVALAANFWTYAAVILGVAVSGLGFAFGRHVGRLYPRRGTTVSAVLLVLFTAVALLTAAAFPLAAIGVVLVVDRGLFALGPRPLVLAFVLGAAVGLVAATWLVLGAASIAILWASVVVPPAPLEIPAKGARPGLAGGALALPLVGFAAASVYPLALGLGFQGEALVPFAFLAVVAGSLVGILAFELVGRARWRTARNGGYLVALAAGISLSVARGPLVVALVLLVLVASLALAATAALRGFAAHGGDLRRSVPSAIAVAVLVLAFVRIPPVAYSLLLGPLPESIEAGFYAPHLVIALVAGIAAFLSLLAHAARPAKHYAPESDGDARGRE